MRDYELENNRFGLFAAGFIWGMGFLALFFDVSIVRKLLVLNFVCLCSIIVYYLLKGGSSNK